MLSFLLKIETTYYKMNLGVVDFYFHFHPTSLNVLGGYYHGPISNLQLVIWR